MNKVFIWSNYWPDYKMRMLAMTHHVRQLQVNPDWSLL
jgi:hypothetical protein